MCRLRGRGLDFTNLVLLLWRAEFGMEGAAKAKRNLLTLCFVFVLCIKLDQGFALETSEPLI